MLAHFRHNALGGARLDEKTRATARFHAEVPHDIGARLKDEHVDRCHDVGNDLVRRQTDGNRKDDLRHVRN